MNDRQDAGGSPSRERDAAEEASEPRARGDDVESVSTAVLTISADRSLDDDPAGDAVVAALDAAGQDVVTRDLVRPSYDGIQSELDTLSRREDVEAVVSAGGTGLGDREKAVEAARPLFDVELPGFAELLRSRLVDVLGTRVVATRAVAGVADCVPIFCLPGDEAAARLGASELVAPEVGRVVELATADVEAEPEADAEVDAPLDEESADASSDAE